MTDGNATIVLACWRNASGDRCRGFAQPAALLAPLCSLALLVFMAFRIECLLSLRGP